MQAIILAAGKSTRTYPLTLTRPKPLLKAANKTLLEHNLDNLNKVVREVIIVVGYKKNLIKKHIGHNYKNLKIRYVDQKRELGTGDALLSAEKYIKNDFISMSGDDIYSKSDIKNIIKDKYSILTKKVENPELFGVIVQNGNVLMDIIEKPRRYVSNLVNTGLYKFDKKIFPLLKKLKKSGRNEYELTDAIKLLSRKQKIYCVAAKRWLPIVYPMDLLIADKVLRKNKNSIGKKAKIYGNIKNSSIGNRCVIRGNIINSIIMDKTVVEKNSLVEASVVGENAYISGKISKSIVSDNVKIKNSTIKNCKISPNNTIENKIIEHDVQ